MRTAYCRLSAVTLCWINDCLINDCLFWCAWDITVIQKKAGPFFFYTHQCKDHEVYWNRIYFTVHISCRNLIDHFTWSFTKPFWASVFVCGFSMLRLGVDVRSANLIMQMIHTLSAYVNRKACKRAEDGWVATAVEWTWVSHHFRTHLFLSFDPVC